MNGIGNKCYEILEEGEILLGCVINIVFLSVMGFEFGLK